MLLNCHTYYSLCYGTLAPEDLLKRAKENGHPAIVLSDINNTSACLNTLRIAADYGVKVIPGIDFRNGIKQQYIGIAQNNNGFKKLNTHLTEHLTHNLPFDNTAPELSDTFIIYPFRTYTGKPLRPNEYVGIQYNELSKFEFNSKGVSTTKLVCLQPVSFTDKKSFNAHRLLRAIDTNNLLSKLPLSEQGSPDEVMLTDDELKKQFQNYPDIISNTLHLLNSSSVSFAYGKFANKNLKYFTGSAQGDIDLLRAEAEKGIAYRFPNPSPVVIERIEKELGIIQQMGFASYFLINHEIVSYARSKGYYYVGRGSGANSLVAYLLRITDVDPIELDLYFERFINPFRSNPPDFDIDFSWTDRDDITEHIFKRFGEGGRAALLGTYSTFQRDAVMRELGKVFGLPPEEIDSLQRTNAASKDDKLAQLVITYSQYLHDFPSHLSIHSSGILIAEEPLTTYSGLFMPPKGYPTTQFSMIEAEDIGLYKFDILSQRGLGKIKDALTLIKENKGVDADIQDIPKLLKDEKIKELLRSGKAIGCFYVESPAMRMLLCKLRADDYLRLVAASSIIRPGVSKSGMMREYILRFRNEKLREKARNELPELYQILEETYGVMVYQEDVIKVAHSFAGLSLAEADYLRRGMSWKFKQRTEFGLVRNRFFDNCRAKGYDSKTITAIWNQIESFANFAFSKGHSASYAVESYQALYLKAYFPIEYMVAALNNGGGFYRPEVYLHEAFLHGAVINPPCVNHSTAKYELIGNQIYLSLALIAELEQSVFDAILLARTRDGAFKSLPDFMERVPVSLDQLRLLISANAFAFTGKKKQTLLWDAHMLSSGTKDNRPPAAALFPKANKTFELPPLHESWIEDAYKEMELYGFTLRLPFYLLQNKELPGLKAGELKHHIGKQVEIVGYLVTLKQTRTAKSEKMFFGTFLDKQGDWIDTVHFPDVAKKYPFAGKGCYLIRGKVVEEFDFICIEVSHFERLDYYDRES